LAAESVSLEDAGGQLDYRILRSQQQLRSGIRPNPLEDVKPFWVSYLRVADEAALAGILSRVEELGGQILLPATIRPSGGKVAVITGPSGAGLALQTWAPGQVPLESSAEGRKTL